MSKKYNFNGKVYNSVAAIARELGKKRIYTREYSKLGIVAIVDEAPATYTTATTYTTAAAIDETPVAVDFSSYTTATTYTSAATVEFVTYVTAATYSTAAVLSILAAAASTDTTVAAATVDAAVEAPAASKKANKPVKKTGTPEDIAEVETNVVDYTREELAAAIRYFTVDALETLARNAGVEKLYEGKHEAIRKMRLIMQIKEAYFPTKENKPAAIDANNPYKGVSTEELEALAAANNVVFNKDRNKGINRMRCIMSLKKAGIVPATATVDAAPAAAIA